MYISNPTKSVPVIMKIFQNFEEVSVYKLNLYKSMLFPVNSKARGNPSGLNTFLFRVSNQFKNNIDKCINLPISLGGQINIVRMNIPPKFLYLFQCIPIVINKDFLIN